MKLLKKINNNFALGLDSSGEEVIVSGKGIGFNKMPCVIEDLNLITRTYYDIDSKYIGLINEIPEEILDISSNIVEYLKRKIEAQLNPNLVFTLADHINFCIERYKKNIMFSYPLAYDYKILYKDEVDVGFQALKMIEKRLGIRLPNDEAIGIAINIVNSEVNKPKHQGSKEFDYLIQNITKLIEGFYKTTVDKNTINYSRFVTHLQYLFMRLANGEAIQSDNNMIFKNLIASTPDTYDCVLEVSKYLDKENNWKLSEEELLYLMIHINRLFMREDCNRKGITP